MLIRPPGVVRGSDITSEQHYLERRKFMQLLGGAMALGASTVLQACSAEPTAADFAGAGGPAVPAGQSPLANYLSLIHI